MPTDPWDPPLDGSGGYFILEYANGIYVHRQRLHIGEFDPSNFLYSAPRGSETHVADTLAAWANIWKLFYTSSWTLSFLSLTHHDVFADTFAPVVPPPAFTPTAGTASGAESTSPAGETTLNLHTTGGNRMKVVLIANQGWDAQNPTIDTSATSGRVGTLMAYLSGANSMIAGHDGRQPVNYSHTTYAMNRRLRRHYHLD